MSSVSMTTGKVTQQHVEEIAERGFSVVPGVVSTDEAAEIKEATKMALKLDEEAYGGRPGKLPHLVVEVLNYRREVFGKLLDNDVMHEVFEHILGKDCILYCFNSAIMPPKQDTSACEIHTDQNVWISADFVGRMLMTLSLDDFTLENGATYHMPNSHHLRERPSKEEFYAKAERCVRKAGDAVFFNTRNWHAGAVNHTDVTRYGLGIQASRCYMKQRLDYPRLLPDDFIASLSERAQRFVGMHSRPPTPDEFYRPPGERMFRT